MTSSTPPPLPRTPSTAKQRRSRISTGTMLVVSGCVVLSIVALVVLRLFHLLIPYSVPTAAMSPAIAAGDNVLMEGMTYLTKKPARGDIIVFKTDDIAAAGPLSLPKRGEIYMKRLVGFPGDKLRLADGMLSVDYQLYVNDQPMSFQNKGGEIHYVRLPSSTYLINASQTVTVPEGCYFVLGDNSPHSADSRLWGFVPVKSVLGRAAFCYWPINHMGPVK